MRNPVEPRIRPAQHRTLTVLASDGNDEHTAAEVARVTGMSRESVLAQLHYLSTIRYVRAYRRAWGTSWTLTGAGRAWLRRNPTPNTSPRATEGADL